MPRPHRCPVALACSALLWSAVVSGEQPKPAPAASEIERLIKRLGSDEFDQREAASKALAALGEAARAALSKAATADDAEVRRRAEKLVEALDEKLYRELLCFKGHRDGVCSAAFSPDGKRVHSAARDNSLLLWDAETGKELRHFPGDGETSFGVAFSPDGKRALSGQFARVRLWDVEAGKELRRFEGHTQYVNSVAFSPDGKRALSGSQDGKIRLWRLSADVAAPKGK